MRKFANHVAFDFLIFCLAFLVTGCTQTKGTGVVAVDDTLEHSTQLPFTNHVVNVLFRDVDGTGGRVTFTLFHDPSFTVGKREDSDWFIRWTADLDGWEIDPHISYSFNEGRWHGVASVPIRRNDVLVRLEFSTYFVDDDHRLQTIVNISGRDRTEYAKALEFDLTSHANTVDTVGLLLPPGEERDGQWPLNTSSRSALGKS